MVFPVTVTPFERKLIPESAYPEHRVPISHFEIMVGGCYASLRSRPVLARGRRWRTTV